MLIISRTRLDKKTEFELYCKDWLRLLLWFLEGWYGDILAISRNYCEYAYQF